MSISDKINSIRTHLEDDYKALEQLGVSVEDRNIENIKDMANQIYAKFPKTSYAEGSNITLSNTLKGKLDFDNGIVGYGDTKQDTTEGYNLVPFPYSSQAGTIASVNWTVNSDGTINASGTADNTSSIFYLTNGDSDIYLDAGTYKISTNLFTDENGFSIQAIKIVNGSYSTVYWNDMVLTERTRLRVRIIAKPNETVNVQNAYMMINSGSTAQPYEKYTGGQASPNPSYPQDIEVVRGKNKFNEEIFTTKTQAGITATFENGKLKISGTASESTNLAWNYHLDNSIKGQICTLSYEGTFSNITNMGLKKTGQDRIILTSSITNKSFEVTQDLINDVNQFSIWINSGSVVNATINIQLEKGSTATSYLPYNTVEVKVQNKNLVDVSKMQLGTISQTDGKTISSSGDVKYSDYINVKPSETYALSFGGGTPTIRIFKYDKNKNYLGTSAGTSSTIAIDSNTYYIRLQGNKSFIDNNFQLELGSTVTSYIAHAETLYQLSLGEYEFAKIGNYVDTIEYDVDEDKVYKNENIKKVMLNSSYRASGGATGTNAYYIATKLTDGLNDNAIALAYSNMFSPCAFNDRSGAPDSVMLQSGSVTLRTRNNTDIDWSDNTKRDAWLNANTPLVYYVLAETVKEEITGTLKDQIKALYYSHSFTGTTIIEINGNLPLIIKVRALKGE